MAAKEAYEEAGLKGNISAKAFAGFASTKRMRSGVTVPCTVRVFLLEVTAVLDEFPEKGQRERRWVTPGEGALMVGETGLAEVLLSFSAMWT